VARLNGERGTGNGERGSGIGERGPRPRSFIHSSACSRWVRSVVIARTERLRHLVDVSLPLPGPRRECPECHEEVAEEVAVEEGEEAAPQTKYPFSRGAHLTTRTALFTNGTNIWPSTRPDRY
jgi:hypothetical protein